MASSCHRLFRRSLLFVFALYLNCSVLPPESMTTMALKFLTVPAITRHTATVIFVHGLGDTGNGWKPVADMFSNDSALQHIKWVLPHSPIRAVRANMGMEMPSWFDVYSFGLNVEEDENGMLESSRALHALITAEIDAGIPADRIILGGFSQGGTMSLLTGLTGERKLAGLAVMSGWLPLKSKFQAMASTHAATTPIFWGHGSADPLVKLQLGRDSTDFLVSVLGVPRAPPSSATSASAPTTPPKGLVWNVYEGIGHTTSQRELDDLRMWIRRIVPTNV
ncbi:Phospholipase/Carboxylesterase-domain-containing protein [Infundibulicybe gibba]|nr:Phospholipase/Carboxylesterase-domain-containing protein [Infundibulicybe gibba]